MSTYGITIPYTGKHFRFMVLAYVNYMKRALNPMAYLKIADSPDGLRIEAQGEKVAGVWHPPNA